MELVSLEIDHFGRIGRAALTFRPGLNVLHGANEVGKSSIARAIRFALLLPPTSSAVDPWIPWTGGGDPTVTLVFRSAPTEYHRVRKVFGSNTPTLERSTNGEGWSLVARGRDVDGRLRAILEWGIAEPGGKGPRGLPESFLATALLADQADVTGIFSTDLGRDDAESGQSQVREALQAMAQDPLFRAVLDDVQRHVDEAFTATGQRKRGAKDPFKKLADDIAARQKEREEAERAADAGRQLQREVERLQREVARADADAHETTDQRQKLEERRARQRELAVALAALGAAQAQVDAVTEADGKAQAEADILSEVEPRLPALRQAVDDTARALQAATADATAALERRKGELAQEEAALLRDQGAWHGRQAVVAAAQDLRKAAGLATDAKALETTLAALDREIGCLEAVEPWLELQAKRAELDAVGQRERGSAELAGQAAELRTRAAAEWPTLRTPLLPDRKALEAIMTRRRNLDRAEDKLDVGLSVAVTGIASAGVAVDGAAKEGRPGPLAIEARTTVEVELPGGIDLVVRGGRPTDRETAERLRTEWHTATDGLFASLGLQELADLEEACQHDAEQKSRADALLREAVSAEAGRTALGDPASDRLILETRLAELEERLVGADRAVIAAAAKAHGAQARKLGIAKAGERDAKRQLLASIGAQEASLRERAAAQPEAAAVTDPDGAARTLAATGADLGKREARLHAERQALAAPSRSPEALERAVTLAKQALDGALSQVANATRDFASWGARLEERRLGAASIDLEALKRAANAARAAAGPDTPPIDEATVLGARQVEVAARARWDRALGDLRKAEGALVGSGGQAADERLRDLDAALQRAHEKQAAREDEYEAWKLLAETLKESEKTQAVHLGSLLAPAILERFQALAGPRYSGIALGPELHLEGIDAAGGRRDFERLSIGTREQLSTVFRLCLAERLRSTLLLDDQLVQSDPDRLRWFRRALRQTAGLGVQVVVLTCRPDDYLEPAEIPGPHVIDLGAVVT